jgi:LAS superfamily LD-carboxypeptidase LdcB
MLQGKEGLLHISGLTQLVKQKKIIQNDANAGSSVKAQHSSIWE